MRSSRRSRPVTSAVWSAGSRGGRWRTRPSLVTRTSSAGRDPGETVACVATAAETRAGRGHPGGRCHVGPDATTTAPSSRTVTPRDQTAAAKRMAPSSRAPPRIAAVPGRIVRGHTDSVPRDDRGAGFARDEVAGRGSTRDGSGFGSARRLLAASPRVPFWIAIPAESRNPAARDRPSLAALGKPPRGFSSAGGRRRARASRTQARRVWQTCHRVGAAGQRGRPRSEPRGTTTDAPCRRRVVDRDFGAPAPRTPRLRAAWTRG